MSKDQIPFSTPDLSQFARLLGQQLKGAGGQPSHLSLLNMLARAGGFRNYQHLRTAKAAQMRVEGQPEPTADFKQVERCLQHFDPAGVLIRWPTKRQVQELCLWVMWSHIPAEQEMHERDVNGILNQAHQFDDAAILRRSLIGIKLMQRNLDGSDYRRIERKPPAEAVVVIREIAQRYGA